MALTKEQFKKARQAGFTTDQIIEFENRKATSDGVSQAPKSTAFLPKEAKVEKLISERTGASERFMEEIKTPFKGGFLQRAAKTGVTALKASAVPFQRVESGVAGLGLGLQKGEPLQGLRQAKAGLLGTRTQELGDIIRTTGFGGKANEAIASGVGFTAAMVAPIKLIKDASKAMRGITKLTDKGLIKAANRLIQGSDDAVKTVGTRLGRVYQPINKVKVNPSKVLDDIADLPQPIIKHIERGVGTTLDDFLQDFTIEKARLLKRTLGEVKPGAFGKAQKGAVELVADKQINRAYSTIKKTMQESLDNVGLKKEATALLKADDAFTDTFNASRFIKKALTDPTIRKPTRVGRVAAKIPQEGELTTRVALNTLKEAGGSARNNINKAVIQLESFNRLQAILGFTGRVGRVAAFSTIAGGIAGKSFRIGE